VPAVWERIEAEVRRQAARRGLDADCTEELIQDVALAACRVTEFRLASGPERFAGVVAHRIIRAKRRAEQRHGVPAGLAGDLADPPASGADDPEARAVLRAGARVELDVLTPAERRALGYPLGPPAASKPDQDRMALRLLRARRRAGAGVRDLLAPAVFRVTARFRNLGSRLANDPVPACASLTAALAGAALGSLGVSHAEVADMPRPQEAVTVAGASAAGLPGADVVGAKSPPPHGQVLLARPQLGLAADNRPGAPAAVATGANLRRTDTEARGEWSTDVTLEGKWSHGTAGVTVYCDSQLRAKVCAALPPQ
jgi:hypothetical protein